MSGPCYQINPLKHSGTSQDRRLLNALLPDGTPVDGRSISDLLIFAEQYASLLNFYDQNNKLNGDWKDFLVKDISTILSAIIVTDINKPITTYYRYFNRIQTAVTADIETIMQLMFSVSFSMLNEIRKWNKSLVLKTDAKYMIMGEISSHLTYALYDLSRYYFQALNFNFFSLVVTPIDPSLETYHFSTSDQVLAQDFTSEWLTQFMTINPGLFTGQPWPAIVNILKTNPASLTDATRIFGDPAWNSRNRLLYACSILRVGFTTIYNAYVRIIKTSVNYFNQSISAYPSHQANNGLMIAFFRLFGIEQNALNRFTANHLNFYYNKVLSIQNKAAVPDSANIVFTLAKNTDDFTIDQGIALLAGKDSLKKEILYDTDTTVSLNKGIITTLSSVFIDDDPSLGGVFQALVTNSADGNGKALPADSPSWFGYGQPQSQLVSAAQRTMTEANVGFVIASPVLFLDEGVREVQITIATRAGDLTAQALGPDDLVSNISLSFTGKKDWVALPDPSSSILASPNMVRVQAAANRILIKFTMPEAMEAILAFNSAIHKILFSTAWPAIRILLKENTPPALYRKLSNVRINEIRIGVNVTGARNCIIASDAGVLDNSNPMMPLGPRPKKGFSFYFGSPEVFSKKITDLRLHMEWVGLPDATLYDYYSYNDGTTDVNYIDIPDTNQRSFTFSSFVQNDGKLESRTPQSASFFNFNNDQTPVASGIIEFKNLFASADPEMDSFESYSALLKRGFLKLQLNNPLQAFGHDAYIKTFTQQVISVNKNGGNNTLPNTPYTPLLQPIVYDYQAEETILFGSGFNTDKGQCFQLFPFGFTELINSKPRILQPFIYAEENLPVQGALFIGIQSLKNGDQLNLYFEMNEGSEDASQDPLGVYWSYLSRNQWKSLKDDLQSDSTTGMLGSGIVRFVVPDDMNENNTLMPAGLKWVRVAVGENNYVAYPKMFSVFTNAVCATFTDDGNDPAHLLQPLPAQTISKLFHPDAAVKQVQQPYPSFNGRMKEAGNPYYTRVSERLRHKNRAITIWDYERLILEQFNYLYKVKCLNHTNDVTEEAPGCVRIITIPSVNPNSGGNLFKPMISNKKKKKIKDYIVQLNCPFAWLEVENPQYEEIRVNCQVQFYAGLLFDEFVKRLKIAVSEFLAPWAFGQISKIDFGGSLHRSVLIKFMEDLPYVDYITDFTMDLFISGAAVLTAVDEVKATTSKSILTSYTDHKIGNQTCLT